MSKPVKPATVYLAGGCFWGKEYHLSRLAGVTATRVGFMGGHVDQPSYQQVCTKTTGHAEVVEVVYDPSVLPFSDLLRFFFSIHDPTVDRRDKGGQYRSAVFFTQPDQGEAAKRLFTDIQSQGHSLSTELQPAMPFWEADRRHQQYCEIRNMTPRMGKGIFAHPEKG